MKYKINKNGVLSGIALSFLAVILGGALFLNILLPSFAAEKAGGEAGGVYFDADSVICDPLKITNENGYYLSPQSYVYFGSVYNASTGAYEPILCRVLDADDDNTGAGGAMFLLTENAITANQVFSDEQQIWVDYLDIENIYTESPMYITTNQANIFTSRERAVIRAITKSDVASEMEGLFGYSSDYGYVWETDTVEDLNAVKSESAELLTESLVFPLSAKELNDYVASYNGALGLSARHVTTKSSVSWWLRTGFDDEYGSLVGVVDESGKVVPKDATSTDVAGRFGFNVETDDILFVENLGNDIYRLVFKSTENENFSANLNDVKDGIIEIKYDNAPTDIVTNDREDNYISIIIKDKEGNVKYYDTNDEAIRLTSGWRSFELPEHYISDEDSIYVFLEQKGDNYWDIGFASELIKLDCIHTPAKTANCINPAICAKCGEQYGSKGYGVHENISSELSFDSEKDVHWNTCNDCGERVNETKCTFGSVCVLNCICGNEENSRIKHEFDENGICIYDKNHYEPPVQIGKGAISDFEIHNVGQFLFLAEYINSNKTVNIYGEYWGTPSTITLMSDLDFIGIDFIPMGIEESPFDALSFEGNGHTIKNINFVTDKDYAGIFGVAQNVYINNFSVTNCNFSAKNTAGVIVGKANNVTIGSVIVLDTIIEATDENGYEGAFVGVAEDKTYITSGSMAYGVYNETNEIIVFSGNDNANVSDSFCLAESSNSQAGEYTLEQFTNGEVGYAYASYWKLRGKKAGQELYVDLYPTFGGATIFVASTCDGKIVYFNDESKRAEIEAHNYTSFAKDPVEFIWQKSEGYKYSCHVHAICGTCSSEGLAECYVSEKIYSSSSAQAVPRIDFTATITLGDVTLSDSYIIISNNIQEYFGVTSVVKSFDGYYVAATDLLENTRLDYDEYTAFFINSKTGKKYSEISYDWYGQPYETPLPVLGVGTYDILLIGEGAFEGQEYLYKEILTINPVTVTITPKDVYRFYDGTVKFTPEFTTDASEELGIEWLSVKYSSSSSSAVGVYTLNVSAEVHPDTYDYNEYKNGIIIVISKPTVSGFILPANKVVIENKNYPTEFTYGDNIPIPSKEHFNINIDTEITFEWFSAKYDYYEEKASELKKIDGQPNNAGTYILRVSAKPNDNTLGATFDLVVEIAQKQIGISIIPPTGAEIREHEGTTYYLIDSINQIKYEIIGLVNGDDAISAGIVVEPYLEGQSPFYDIPDRKNYRIMYYVDCHDELGISGNYTCEPCAIYVSVTPNSIPTPQANKYIYENKNVEYEVLISWKAPGVTEEYGGYYEYMVEIYDVNDNLVFNQTKGSLYSFASTDCMPRLNKSGEYTVIIKCALRNFYGGTTTDEYVLDSYEFTVSITDENGKECQNINSIGKYTVTVDCNDQSASCEIFVQRRITMLVKETFINLDDASIIFNKENIVMRAGEVLLLGHTLADVEFDINAERGEITVKSIVVLDQNGNDVSHLYSINNYDSSGKYNILHVYDSACDSECNSDYCQTTRVAAHSGGKATCTTLATCSLCGKQYGDYDRSAHTTERTTFVVNPENHDTHLELANCCGALISARGHTPKTVATCTTRAHCALCDWTYGELDANNHSSTDISYSQIQGNAHEHLITHICCGATESEFHYGGKATCATLAKCEKCEAAYGAFDADNHEKEAVYTHNSENPSEHIVSYPCCNASFSEAHSGGAATCSHAEICAYCNKAYGGMNPEKHTGTWFKYTVNDDNPSMHDIQYPCCGAYVGKEYHSGGTANCKTPALCEHCGTAYGDVDLSVHKSEKFKYIADGKTHVKVYACCKEEIAIEEHNSEPATCLHGTICTLCGYEQGERAEHIYDNDCDYICNVCNEITRAAGFHVDNDGNHFCDNCEAEIESDGLSGGAVSGIVVGSVTAAGIGGFSLFWFAIKKKSLAALLKLLFA